MMRVLGLQSSLRGCIGGGAGRTSSPARLQGRPFIITSSASSSSSSSSSPPPPPSPSSSSYSGTLEDLVRFVETHDAVSVITGAGISTESDIPDYRGPNGAYTTGFKPMMHQKFVSCEKTRKRYWGRSMLGWEKFRHCRPNLAHLALARLEEMGQVSGIITQNVDRLHQKAGSKKVLELHGTTHEVICLDCDYRCSRDQMQLDLKKLNPALADAQRWRILDGQGKLRARHSTAEGTPGLQRPDGDVEVEIDEGFIVPPCPSCSGLLKPDVIFFGDNVPRQRVEAANSLIKSSDGILVIGSSLMVFSAYRLCKLAEEHGIPVAVLNSKSISLSLSLSRAHLIPTDMTTVLTPISLYISG